MEKDTTANEKFTKAFINVGKLEGYSYLLLLGIAMPLKYAFNLPEYVRIAGTIHGILFVGFVVLLLIMLIVVKLSLKKAALSFLLSLIPFGTFFLKRVVAK
ncbi:MAG: DUF3817 domain-containing protein [Bacteroidia bacterium]